tara:strand:+ start:95651 stop:96856 length:1206 start_codon:yes stop_codon:yes gene_type:complete
LPAGKALAEIRLAVNEAQVSEYQLLDNDQELNRLCQHWRQKDYLALDTEFVRVDSFYPRLGLIQVNDGEQNYLIDPLQISQWQAFTDLMQADSLVKIFHSCSEDLLVFAHVYKLLPKPVFDTQIANAFLDQGFALSYQNMVAEYFGHDIPKGETRSDWLQRPLSDSQLHYAALDVEYLPEVYRRQRTELEKLGRLEWLQEDCARLRHNYADELQQDFSQAYKSMSAAWSFDDTQLSVLKVLAQWREQRARERDKPKNWILRDHALLAIARICPQELSQFSRIEKLNRNFVQYEGKKVLELVQEAITHPEPVEHVFPRPLSGSQKKRFKQLQACVREHAEKLSIPVEVLGRKRLLMALFNAVTLQQEAQGRQEIDRQSLEIPEELQGWRKQILLDDLLEILQ